MSDHTPASREPEPQPPRREKPAPEAEPDDEDEVERRLDEALADSFPASDPVSIVTSQHEEAWQKDRARK